MSEANEADRTRGGQEFSESLKETLLQYFRLLLCMYYTYILKSELNEDLFYVGCTSNLRRRFLEHNRGDCSHTAQYRPWRLINYTAFLRRAKAEEFERYLKTCSGRKFQWRHMGE